MENNVGEKYLPIGTVVLLKGGFKRLMITGFCVSSQEKKDEVWDYVGCLFPEGVLSTGTNCVFDHNQIAKVVYMGLIDDEEKNFKKLLAEAVASEKKKSELNKEETEEETTKQEYSEEPESEQVEEPEYKEESEPEQVEEPEYTEEPEPVPVEEPEYTEEPEPVPVEEPEYTEELESVPVEEPEYTEEPESVPVEEPMNTEEPETVLTNEELKAEDDVVPVVEEQVVPKVSQAFEEKVQDIPVDTSPEVPAFENVPEQKVFDEEPLPKKPVPEAVNEIQIDEPTPEEDAAQKASHDAIEDLSKLFND